MSVNCVKKILFYYPNSGIGGVQILFLKLARFLSQNDTLEVKLIDNPCGYMAKNAGLNVRFQDVAAFKKTADKLDSCFVIAPLSEIKTLEKIVNSRKSRVIYWCLHPENLVDIYRGAQRFRSFPRTRDIVVRVVFLFTWLSVRAQLMSAMMEGRVLFMDAPNAKRTLSFYKIKKNPQYLPICTDIDASDDGRFKRFPLATLNTNLHMMWLGRLSGDKIASLEYTIEHLSALDNASSIYLHVVGDGEKIPMVEKLLDKSAINIVIQGSIANTELKAFVKSNHIYCGFGMGTSVLEMAKLSVPSIIVDPAFSKHEKDYKPRWLYMTKNYNLGSFVHDSAGNDICALLDDLKSDYGKVSRMCYSYVTSHHTTTIVARKLIEHLG